MTDQRAGDPVSEVTRSARKSAAVPVQIRPVRVLSAGAGTQSSGYALKVFAGEFEPFDAGIFADTGCEPREVYAYLWWLAGEFAKAGVPLYVVSTGNLMEDALDPTHRFASMPLFVKLREPRWDAKRKRWVTKGMVRRQCTSEYKLKPIIAMQQQLAGIKPRSRPKGIRVVSIQGISSDESERMKDPLRPWMRNEYPLVDAELNRWDVIRWMAEHGYPRAPRSACKICPFHTDAEWRHLRDNQPEDWAEAVEFDKAIRSGNARGEVRLDGEAYLHSSLVPLDEVDLSTPEDHGQGVLFPDCDPWGCSNVIPAGFIEVDAA